jgi:branched-chain amino acid aminotransferase
MAITAPLLWLDGEMVASKSAGAPLMGHAAQRGSLVFDVGSFHQTSRGPALFRPRDHVARFLRSARIVGLELAFDEEALVQAAIRVVAESGSADGLVRWSAFLRAREPDLVPHDHSTHIAVAAQMLQDPPRRAPIRVAVFSDARKAAPDVLPPDTKAAGAYLGPMLARKRAIAAGADDVVLLDRDGEIAEAPIANAFAIVSGALWTPPLGRVLPGITRDSVLAIARAEGIPVREERMPLEAFASADEAFLTATSLPISPIGWVNGRALREAPGPITSRLIDGLTKARRGDDPKRDAWLTHVHDGRDRLH